MWLRLSRKPSRGIADLNKKSSRHILCRDSGLVPGPSVDWPRVCRFGHRSHSRVPSKRIWQIEGPCSSALQVFGLQCRWSPARLADPRGPWVEIDSTGTARLRSKHPPREKLWSKRLPRDTILTQTQSRDNRQSAKSRVERGYLQNRAAGNLPNRATGNRQAGNLTNLARLGPLQKQTRISAQFITLCF